MNRESLGLAGEYAVASELCKRGFYAQLTLGNHKKTDLLVETEDKLFRVSVKAKRGYEWPSVKGIWAKGDIIVFVDFKGKDDLERPNFYVLGVEEWLKLIKIIRKEKVGSKIDKKTNTVFWDPWSKTSKGWRGCSIRVKHVEEYKDKWPSV
jgi:hypothetical protein